MAPLLLKLVLTPILVSAATLAGRRWGGRVGGWLVGFPFTSGPIALILTVQEGSHFAAAAALGTLLGTASQAAFALVYGRLAGAGRGWSVCMAGGTAVFALATVLLSGVRPSPIEAGVAVVIAISLALVLLPRVEAAAPARTPWRFDLPARAAVATVFVVALTSIAPVLGPRLSGLITPFPLYASVLAVFAHRADGPQAGLAVVRGLAAGLFGFGSFFLVLALALVPLGPPAAFLAAIAVVAVVQAMALLALRR